jgi:hypothetical protein
MIVARITQTVIAARFVPAAERPAAITAPVGAPEQCRQDLGQAAPMPGVDVDLDAHSGAQRRPALVAGVETNAQRDALHDLHPVAAGVLRGQQRELLRRRRADALDGAVPFQVRIGVHRHRDRLPGTHIGQLRLFRIRVDPDVIRGDEIEGGHRGLQVLAGRDRGHIGHDAGERRLHDRVVELAGSFVPLRNGIAIARMLLDRDDGVAVEICGDGRKLLVERGQLLLRVLRLRRAVSKVCCDATFLAARSC